MIPLDLEDFEKDEKSDYLRGALKTCVNKAQSFYADEIEPYLDEGTSNHSRAEEQFWSLFASFIHAVFEHVNVGDVDLFCITVDSGDINAILNEFFCLVKIRNVHSQQHLKNEDDKTANVKLDEQKKIFEEAPVFPILEISAADRHWHKLLPAVDLRSDIEQIDQFLLLLDSRGICAPRLELHLLQMSLLHEYASWIVQCIEGKRFVSPAHDRVNRKFRGISGANRALKAIIGKRSGRWFWLFLVAATIAAGFNYAWAAVPFVMLAFAELRGINRHKPETYSPAAIHREFTKTLDHLALAIFHLAPLERSMIEAQKAGVLWPASSYTLLDHLRPFASEMRIFSSDNGESKRESVAQSVIDRILNSR